MKILCWLLIFVWVAKLSVFADVAHDLEQALRDSKIARIDVVSAPVNTESSHAVDPARLDIIATERVTINNSANTETIRLLLTSLNRAMPEAMPSDPRWGALQLNLRFGARFFDAQSRQTFDLYLDAQRVRGTIKGQLYKFPPSMTEWFISVMRRQTPKPVK